MTVEEVYLNTTRTYGKKPDDAQLDAWISLFSSFPAQFLDSAVKEWQAQTDEDEFYRKPKGSIFPQIADLLKLAKRIEIRAKMQNRFTPCGKCSSGWAHCTIPGVKPGTTETAVRRCQCWKDWTISRGKEIK